MSWLRANRNLLVLPGGRTGRSVQPLSGIMSNAYSRPVAATHPLRVEYRQWMLFRTFSCLVPDCNGYSERTARNRGLFPIIDPTHAPASLRTRGSWVQILPGAPIIKDLGPQNQVLVDSAGPLRDLLSTGSALGNPQNRLASLSLQHSVSHTNEPTNVTACVMIGHGRCGVAEQGGPIFRADARRAQA